MSVYTAIGSQIHSWEPLRAVVHAHDDLLGFVAQQLWLQLYTMPEAKNGIPGLMLASVNMIAEATGKSADLVRSCIDRLIEHELVEIDVARRVLRLTQLPDSLEFPPNANVVRSWWRRFRNIPDCPLKFAHVTTIRWVFDERSRERGKGWPMWLQEIWDETFGTVSVPVPRKRGARRLQMNLFPEASEDEVDRSGNGSRAVDDARSVDNSAADPKPKEIKISETVSEPFSNGRDQDQDQVSVSSLSGGGSGEGHDPGTASSSRPHLAIVPEDGPYGPELLLKTLEARSKNRSVSGVPDQTLWPALRAAVAHLHAHGVTLADLELTSSWLGRGLAVEGTEGRPYLGAWWAAKPNVVLFAVQRARIAAADEERKRAEGERRSRELRDVMSQGPYTIPTT